jgi:hypothetical protein
MLCSFRPSAKGRGGLAGACRRRALLLRSFQGTGNAVVRIALESRIANPIMSGSIEIGVRWRTDLFAVDSYSPVAPVAFPATSGLNEACVRGRRRNDAVGAGALIARAASPLPIVGLEGPLAWQVRGILHTKPGKLPEAIVAGPPLLGGAVVRMDRDVAIRLLRTGRTYRENGAGPRQADPKQQLHQRQSRSHAKHHAAFSQLDPMRLDTSVPDRTLGALHFELSPRHQLQLAWDFTKGCAEPRPPDVTPNQYSN